MSSLRKIAVFFLFLQSCGAGLWWILLFFNKPFRAFFLSPNSPEENLLAFLIPDVVLYIGAALLAAYGFIRKENWAWGMLCIHTGAAIYAGLYSIGLMIFSGGHAWLGAVLMYPSMIVLSLLTFLLHPARAGFSLEIKTHPAAPASDGWNILKTMIQSFFFWLTFLFFIPALIYFAERNFGWPQWKFESFTTQTAGLLLFTIGSILCLMSGIYMAVAGKGTPLPLDCPNELVITGPYKYVRNPMATAAILQGIAVGIFLGSWIIIIYSILGGVIWHLFIRPWEETDLEKRFGKNYLEYKSGVRCWMPRLKAYTSK